MHCHALIHLHLFHVCSMHWKICGHHISATIVDKNLNFFLDCFVFISTIIYPINKIHVLHCMQDNFLHLHLHLFHALEQICGHHISANIVDKNLILFDCFVFLPNIIYLTNKIHVLHCMQDDFLHLQ